MTDNETTEGASSEPIAGTNLTTITEYTDTALALSQLRGRFQNLVVDLSTPKGLKAAKADVAELRTLRTSLDKKREELVKPALERQREVNAEAKRLTAEIVALEEPLKLQVDAKEAEIENARLQKLEEERLRVEAILAQIQAIRDIPTSLIGKPAVIIQGQLAKLQALELTEEGMAEHYQTALDARDAVIGRVTTMLHDQKEADAEKQRQIERDAEMEAMRKEKAEMQAKLDQAEAERVARERREAAEEAAAGQAKQEAAAAAQRKIAEDEKRRVQTIRNRINSIIDVGLGIEGASSENLQSKIETLEGWRPSNDADGFAELIGEASLVWDETFDKLLEELAAASMRERAAADAQAAREAEDARQQEERARLNAQQELLAKEAVALAREKVAAAKKAEELRLANLGLRDAARAVAEWADLRELDMEQVFIDLRVALANDAAPAKPSRAKKAARA